MYLGNEFVVVGKMRSAVNTAVAPVAFVWYVVLKFSLPHAFQLSQNNQVEFSSSDQLVYTDRFVYMDPNRKYHTWMAGLYMYSTVYCTCTGSYGCRGRGARNWREIKLAHYYYHCGVWPLTQYPSLAGCDLSSSGKLAWAEVLKPVHQSPVDGLSRQTSARDSSWPGVWCRPTLLWTLVYRRGSVRDGLVSKKKKTKKKTKRLSDRFGFDTSWFVVRF